MEKSKAGKVVKLKPKTVEQKDKEAIKDSSPFDRVFDHAQECALANRSAVINHEDYGFISAYGQAWMLNLFLQRAWLIADNGKKLGYNTKVPYYKLSVSAGYDCNTQDGTIDPALIFDFQPDNKKGGTAVSLRVPEPAARQLLAWYCFKKGCNLGLIL